MKRLALVCVASVLFAACSSHGGTPLVPGAMPAGAGDLTASLHLPTGVPAASLGQVEFNVALPLRNQAELDRFLAAVSDPDSPSYREFMTREQFLERYGPSQADLAAVAQELRRAGFRVSIMDQAVAAGGTRAQAERYFATHLTAGAGGEFVRTSALRLSPALSSRGAMVVGFEPMAFRVDSERVALPATGRLPHNRTSPVGPYFTSDMKEAYQFPSYQVATGKGVTIGIIISSPVKTSDVTAYFKDQLLKVSPKVVNVAVDGGGKYSAGSDGTFEATLDAEQSLGMAPGAEAKVFNFPSLSNGNQIYDAYTKAVDASVAVVNSSFGLCESSNPLSAYTAFDDVFKQGLAAGTTFVAASGDHADANCGSNAEGNPDKKGVSWPASSSYVLAVGGTNLKTQFVKSSNESGYVSEEAYEDNLGEGSHWGSGGGYSGAGYYARPSWQAGFVSGTKRGVPDIALHMGGCPEGAVQPCNKDDSADIEVLAGKESGAVGTSASSPDAVGLIALATQLSGKPFGDIHSLLYQAAKVSGLLHRGIKGNNGYPTTSGLWDPVLGIGTPDAAFKIAGASAAAGVPGTPSNP
ncbi:MAG TPA: S53 family serine peptidase [Verrucomicrobiae bacterium]|nr:S53 family serine peptidase [Verrucomicrobiae bacterium]